MGLMDKLYSQFNISGSTKDDVVQVEVQIDKLQPEYEIIDEYYINEPNSKVYIVRSDELGEGSHYFIQEASLNEAQYKTYQTIVRILSKEFESPTEEHVDPKEYVYEQAELIAEKYHRSLGQFTIAEWDQVFYYVVRDLIGYGPLQAIMEDPQIEDISCNGLDVPIFVWHRKHESIPTNTIFRSTQTLNDFLVKLAHKSGKHISSAQPLLDAMLPEKHRLAATFMNEVSMKGSTFCIRKFSADPLSIVDLINIGTLNEKIAAYFWLILEYKKSFMIVGGTGAGKTSSLNALLSLMSQNDKIVTVEEVPELSPPVANWTQLNSRESFQFGEGPSGDITLFDLIKVSLRYRPDYVIVGEVRGEEAYVLFQALATGHGGLCTMHSDSIDGIVKRLTSPPMNVSEVYIPLMNVALYIQRVELPQKSEGLAFGRRVRSVSEIADFEDYREVVSWDPLTDTFLANFENSIILDQISEKSRYSKEELMEELDIREAFIKQIIKSGIRDQRLVAERILSYYTKQRDQKGQSLDPIEPIKVEETNEVQLFDYNVLFTPENPLEETETEFDGLLDEQEEDNLSDVEETLISLPNITPPTKNNEEVDDDQSNLKMSLDAASKILLDISHDSEHTSHEEKESDTSVTTKEGDENQS